MSATEPLLLPAGPDGRMVALYGGPMLLSGPLPMPSLVTHRRTWPVPLSRPTTANLVRLLAGVGVTGRGGAGFPFARKLAAAAEAPRTAAVVVNVAESEPGSSKDSSLLLAAPHLVLDGAELVASALGAREVRVVVSGGRSPVEAAVTRALAQREGGLSWTVTATTGGFVGGQSSAVLELLAGRPNRPVTKWNSAAHGDRRRPATLLSNAETFAHTAALVALGGAGYRRWGSAEEPGTTLLSIGGDGIVDTDTAVVGEVQHGIALPDVLTSLRGDPPAAVLLGGYHGIWVPWQLMTQVIVSRQLSRGGTPALGPGIVLPLSADRCPLAATADIVAYLTAARARQCGPCEGGLPDLAVATRSLSSVGPGAAGAADRVVAIARMVNGRGACAHPDGTARLAYSAIDAFQAEVDAHEHGGCLAAEPVPGSARPPRLHDQRGPGDVTRHSSPRRAAAAASELRTA